jgi:hypothetical protein
MLRSHFDFTNAQLLIIPAPAICFTKQVVWCSRSVTESGVRPKHYSVHGPAWTNQQQATLNTVPSRGSHATSAEGVAKEVHCTYNNSNPDEA